MTAYCFKPVRFFLCFCFENTLVYFVDDKNEELEESVEVIYFHYKQEIVLNNVFFSKKNPKKRHFNKFNLFKTFQRIAFSVSNHKEWLDLIICK